MDEEHVEKSTQTEDGKIAPKLPLIMLEVLFL